MKKAVVILYIVAATQALGTIIAFAVAYEIMDRAFYKAGESIGEMVIKVCDQRYIQK